MTQEKNNSDFPVAWAADVVKKVIHTAEERKLSRKLEKQTIL